MAGAQFVEDLALAVALVATAAGAEPEEVLEALPFVMQKVRENYQQEQPSYVTWSK